MGKERESEKLNENVGAATVVSCDPLIILGMFLQGGQTDLVCRHAAKGAQEHSWHDVPAACLDATKVTINATHESAEAEKRNMRR